MACMGLTRAAAVRGIRDASNTKTRLAATLPSSTHQDGRKMKSSIKPAMIFTPKYERHRLTGAQISASTSVSRP